MKEVKIEHSNGCVTVFIYGDIDHHSAKSVRASADAAIRDCRPREVILDFSGVGFMDSSGIGLIIGRASAAETVGAILSVVGLSPALMKLVRMAGIEKIKGLRIGDIG